MSSTEITTRESTEDDYNAQSRYIVMKLAIYFNGLNNEPLEVTKDTY